MSHVNEFRLISTDRQSKKYADNDLLLHDSCDLDIFVSSTTGGMLVFDFYTISHTSNLWCIQGRLHEDSFNWLQRFGFSHYLADIQGQIIDDKLRVSTDNFHVRSSLDLWNDSTIITQVNGKMYLDESTADYLFRFESIERINIAAIIFFKDNLIESYRELIKRICDTNEHITVEQSKITVILDPQTYDITIDVMFSSIPCLTIMGCNITDFITIITREYNLQENRLTTSTSLKSQFALELQNVDITIAAPVDISYTPGSSECTCFLDLSENIHNDYDVWIQNIDKWTPNYIFEQDAMKTWQMRPQLKLGPSLEVDIDITSDTIIRWRSIDSKLHCCVEEANFEFIGVVNYPNLFFSSVILRPESINLIDLIPNSNMPLILQELCLNRVEDLSIQITICSDEKLNLEAHISDACTLDLTETTTLSNCRGIWTQEGDQLLNFRLEYSLHFKTEISELRSSYIAMIEDKWIMKSEIGICRLVELISVTTPSHTNQIRIILGDLILKETNLEFDMQNKRWKFKSQSDDLELQFNSDSTEERLHLISDQNLQLRFRDDKIHVLTKNEIFINLSELN
jgi:hypothetical protein